MKSRGMGGQGRGELGWMGREVNRDMVEKMTRLVVLHLRMGRGQVFEVCKVMWDWDLSLQLVQGE